MSIPKNKLKKGLFTNVELSTDNKVTVILVNGLSFKFETFGNVSGEYIFSDGRLRATFKNKQVCFVFLPERYVKDYPSYVSLVDKTKTFAKIISGDDDKLVIETVVRERHTIKLSEIEYVEIEKISKLQKTKSMNIQVGGNITLRSSEIGFAYTNFTLQRGTKNQLVAVNLLTTNPELKRIIFCVQLYGLKWRFQTDGYAFTSPAIGIDGTIYVGSYE